MQDRIKRVMAAVLNIKTADINQDTSIQTVKEWDSLKQIDLIVALEEEFSIAFDDEETTQLDSFPKICDFVEKNLSHQ